MRRGSLTLRFEILETRTLLSVTPNNTYYPQQWGLNNSNNVDVDAPQAWDLNTGSSSVIVAAIGITGVDLTNPDLTNRIWANPNPNSDPNYPGALHGWNFETNSPTITDTNGHDTNVAGIVAAQTNNSQGIAGVTWGCSFMPLVANTNLEDAAAVNFAVAHGAKVINMSFDYPESPVFFSSDQLYQAIQNAASSGVVFVAAAGNGGTSGSPSNPGQDLATLSPTVCPAAFRLPNMINVASVDSSGNLASSSNYGATTVDLGAPGVNIYTTGLNGGYISYAAGTSFAAPFVTGVVALVQSEFPSLSAQQVVQLVVRNTKPLASLSGKTISGGMVDAYNALLAGFPSPTASASPSIVTGTTTALSVSDSYGAGDSDLTYTWSVTNMPSGVSAPSFSINGTSSAKSTTATFYASGNYTFQATVSDGDGFTRIASVSLTVSQTASTITVSPASATLADRGSQGFTALVDDQFGAAISSPALSWSVNSGGVGGTISQSGTYTAPASGTGTDTVKVTSGSAAATATVTVTASTQASIAIDCGSSSAVGSFVADTPYVTSTRGGPYSTGDGVDTSAVPDPAPLAVYQTGEYGDFTYTIPSLVPGSTYTLLLSFVEFAHNGVGQRVFNVLINGTTVLSDYDIYAQAGATHKAVYQMVSGVADSTGTLRVQFQTVVDGAYCSAIQIYRILPATSGGGNGPQLVQGSSPVKESLTTSTSDAAVGVASLVSSNGPSIASLPFLGQVVDAVSAGAPRTELVASAMSRSVLGGPVLTPSNLARVFDDLLSDQRWVPFGRESRFGADFEGNWGS